MKYLFLSPYGAVHDWRFSEYQIQKILSSSNEVAIIKCNSILHNHCMAIKALTQNKFFKNSFYVNRICKRCCFNQKQYSKNYKSFTIDDYISDLDNKIVSKILLNINKNNFINFEYDKIKIGRISIFDSMLLYKKDNMSFSTEEFIEIKKTISTLLLFVFALKKISKEYTPDIVICQNGNYSLSKLFTDYFHRKKVDSYAWEASTHHLNRFDKIFITKNDMNFGINSMKKNWNFNLRNNKKFITRKNIESVNTHFKTVIDAKALRSFSKKYSYNEKTVREYFGISKKKIILLSTSSWDEVIGTYVLKGYDIDSLLIFKRQSEWVRKCINFFSNHTDCQLIIRPHPRDYNNFNSELMVFLNKLKALPVNITINKPQDKISLYSILKDTSLVLNAWSTLGMEAGILNIPVLSISDELIAYPREIEHYQNNENAYFRKINNLLLLNDYKFNMIQCKNFYNFMTVFLDYSNLTLDIKKTQSSFVLAKIFDKLSIPILKKGFLKNFMGKSIRIEENQRILDNFFNNRNNTLNEVSYNFKFDNKEKANDNDYINGFLDLSKKILNKIDNTVLSKKVNNLLNDNKF
jgi:hypothetical protein